MAAKKKTTAAPVKPRAPRALKLYNTKRRFDVTAEPAGTASATARGDSFVIQQHDATRMHYDFRLELDGVLLSWAVPKGPSLSPREKRLAVQTEDHPVSYRNFEGNIPHGEYGGGPVIVWDRGRWTPEGDARAALKKGHLSFSLRGEKLQGRYSLVRTGGAVKEGPKSTWLLFKRSDEHAREGAEAEITRLLPNSVISDRTVQDVGKSLAAKHAPVRPPAKARAPRKAVPGKLAPLPALKDIEPQLATLVDHPPTGGDWLYEVKFDGYRMLAAVADGEVQLRSRNQLDWTRTFPAIAAALGRLDCASAILDGEVCYMTDEGRSSFQGLQGVLPRGGGEVPVAEQKRLVFYLFDVLHHDGVDVRRDSLAERKQRLRILLGKKPKAPLAYSAHVDALGRTAMAQACAAGLEGLIAKRADAPYRGGRGGDWLKLKCQQRQEFVIVGYLPAEGTRQGFRSLLLGLREGKALRYAGKVGTGFNDRSLRDIAAELRRRVVGKSALAKPPRLAGAVWVAPELVCEVEYTEMTRDGALRHPSFQGLRQDKPAREVRRERAVPVAEAGATPRTAAPGRLEVAGLRISHPERVMDQTSGVTKGELAEYHALVAPLLMPYAENRPLALVRCPQGDAQACFFQKQKMAGLGKAIRAATVAGHEILYTRSAAGILELVQFNAVELHAWGATMARVGKPDWLVIDLDPDVSLGFADVVESALEVRDALAKLGLKTFVKTTGGKGLHVVIPLVPDAGWEEAKGFTRSIAEALATYAPDRYVATMSKAKRAGKIFIDWLRNGQGATAVLPYSPRARPGATVAMPVDWKDLRRIDPREFTVRSAKAYLAKRRRDPWAEFFDSRQRLPI